MWQKIWWQKERFLGVGAPRKSRKQDQECWLSQLKMPQTYCKLSILPGGGKFPLLPRQFYEVATSLLKSGLLQFVIADLLQLC